MKESPMRKDLVIIGGGMAGLTAAMHASIMALDYVVIQKTPYVGQIPEAYMKKNYPGMRNIKGEEMARNIEEQINLDFSVEIKREEVMDIVVNTTAVPYRFLVKTDYDHYLAKTMILATGSRPEELSIVGSSLKGISYHPLFDSHEFKGKDVVILGINDNSVQFTFWLKELASSITLIEESPVSSASPMNMYDLERNVEDSEQAVNILMNHEVISINGSDHVESIRIRDRESGEEIDIPATAMIISSRRVPNSELARKLECDLDKEGFILVNREQKTGVEGVFAAGDVAGIVLATVKSAGEGCVAGLKAAEYIRTGRW